MGFGSLFRSVFDRKLMGKEIIKKQIETYYQQRNLYPDQSPHIHLAQVWLSRQAARGANINAQEIQSLSYTETLLIACIPHPHCAEALGLFILYEEHPDIPKDFPEFAMSYIKLLRPAIEAKEKGNLEQLYRKYNHNIPKGYVELLFDKE